MLLLKRKVDEEIRINSDIIVKVIAVSGNTVQLGIIAAPEIKIYRGEVYEMVKANTKQAAEESKVKLGVKLNNLSINKIN